MKQHKGFLYDVFFYQGAGCQAMIFDNDKEVLHTTAMVQDESTAIAHAVQWIEDQLRFQIKLTPRQHELLEMDCYAEYEEEDDPCLNWPDGKELREELRAGREISVTWILLAELEEFADRDQDPNDQRVYKRVLKKAREIYSEGIAELYKLEDIPSYGDHITIQKFTRWCKNGLTIDYDGHARYATEDKISTLYVNPSQIVAGDRHPLFTHVVWFNR